MNRLESGRLAPLTGRKYKCPRVDVAKIMRLIDRIPRAAGYADVLASVISKTLREGGVYHEAECIEVWDNV